MTKRHFLIAAVLLLSISSAFAQGNGLSGINQATNMVTSYFDPATKLIYAIGAVVGLIGGVNEFRGRVEIARHHACRLVDTRQTVALGKGRGNGKQQNGCDKKMFLGHKSLFCVERIGYVLPTDEYCCYFRMLVVAL